MTELTPAFVDAIRNDLDLEVVGDYSGRGMYGKRCLAIMGGMHDLMKFALNLRDMLQDYDVIGTTADFIDSDWLDAHCDSMGKDLVFYWPNVEVVEDEEPDPDADFGGTLNPVDFSRN